MPNHTLEIIPRGSCSADKSVVVPGCHEVDISDSVTWEARDTDAILFFPDECLFGRHVLEINADERQTLKVREQTSGRYPYAIYCAKSGEFAEGGSHPVLIVRR